MPQALVVLQRRDGSRLYVNDREIALALAAAMAKVEEQHVLPLAQLPKERKVNEKSKKRALLPVLTLVTELNTAEKAEIAEETAKKPTNMADVMTVVETVTADRQDGGYVDTAQLVNTTPIVEAKCALTNAAPVAPMAPVAIVANVAKEKELTTVKLELTVVKAQLMDPSLAGVRNKLEKKHKQLSTVLRALLSEDG